MIIPKMQPFSIPLPQLLGNQKSLRVKIPGIIELCIRIKQIQKEQCRQPDLSIPAQNGPLRPCPYQFGKNSGIFHNIYTFLLPCGHACQTAQCHKGQQYWFFLSVKSFDSFMGCPVFFSGVDAICQRMVGKVILQKSCRIIQPRPSLCRRQGGILCPIHLFFQKQSQ